MSDRLAHAAAGAGSERWFALIVEGRRGFRRVDEPVAHQRPPGSPAPKRRRTERIYGEFDTVERLAREHIEAFAPALAIRVRAGARHRKRWEIRQVPLVPGYCFARFPAGLAPQRLGAWAGIRDVVRMGSDPYVIPAAQIAALRALAEAAADPTGGARDARRRLIAVGQPVLMTGEAWQGILGKVEAVHRQQVIVLLEFLGAERRITTTAEELEVVA